MTKIQKPLQIIILIIFTLGLIGPTALTAGAAHVKAHPLLIQIADQTPQKQVDVIVQKLVRDNHLEDAVARLGGEVTKELYIINAFAAKMTATDAIKLSSDPGVRWVSLDAPVLQGSGAEASQAVSLRVDFNQPVFSDVSSNWNQEWREIGENDGAENGNVLITSFYGGLAEGVRIQGASTGLQSGVSLQNTTNASLSIEYRRKDFEGETDYVAIEISPDGGNNWVEIDRLSGPASDSDLIVSQYDLSAFIPGEVNLRFITSPSMGFSGKFYLNYVQIDYLASAKPEPELPYAVRLPLVVSTNTDPIYEMDPDSSLAIEFNYSKVVRDDFTTGTFSENDGNTLWKNNWSKSDVAGAGPTTGNITITSGELSLMDRPDTGTEPNIAREVDLSSAIAAVFSFSYRTTNGVDADDAVTLAVSKDGGATYSPLHTYKGIVGATSGTGYFDLSAYLSANTKVRFMVSNNYGDNDENFVINYVQIAYAPRLGETVRDEFNTVSYENNNGTRAWNGAWIEYDPDGGGGATSGYVKVNSNSYRLTFHYSWSEYITRKVNLSGSNQAVLSFNWQTIGLDENEKLSILISKDGTSPFVEIGALVGNQTGTFSYDISAYISQNTTIKLGNIAEFWEYGEYAYVDNLQIAFESYCPNCFATTNLESLFVKSIGADVLWNEANYLQGQGITVAVLDSGITPHQDFLGVSGQSRILTHVEFLSQGSSQDDFYGHGTHVAGSIGGNGARSNNRYAGVAPKVNLVDVKVMDDLGIGTTSDVVAGIQWIYENKDLYNIRVVNLSLNSTVEEPYSVSALDAALEILWFNGIVVVVSAGNNGSSASGILYPPANDPFVITVGAVDDMGTRDTSDDVLASFSAFGTTSSGFSKPDLVVPGRNIISPLASDDCNLIIQHPDHAVTGDNGTYYFRMSGTSMASGVAAGAVALLLQDEPNLTPDQVKYRLMTTARPFQGGNGSGYMDIYQAVHSDTTGSANTGINASQLLWGGPDPITWGSVAWNSVAWNSVAWNSVAWNSVAWNSVAWNSTYWGP
jgi:serine protease AprX